MHSHCIPGTVLTFSCISAHLIFITTLGFRCYGSHIIPEKLRPEGINKENEAAGSRDAGPRGLLPAWVSLTASPMPLPTQFLFQLPHKILTACSLPKRATPMEPPCKVCFLEMRVTCTTLRPREAKQDSLVSSKGSSCYGVRVSEGTDDRKKLSEEKSLKNKKKVRAWAADMQGGAWAASSGRARAARRRQAAGERKT